MRGGYFSRPVCRGRRPDRVFPRGRFSRPTTLVARICRPRPVGPAPPTIFLGSVPHCRNSRVAAKELGEDLGPFPFIVGADSHDPDYVSAVRKLSLDWAINQANMLFYVTMAELIQKHPLDSVDDDAMPFWSGTRRAPKPMRFIPLDSEDGEVSAQQVIINEIITQDHHRKNKINYDWTLGKVVPR